MESKKLKAADITKDLVVEEIREFVVDEYLKAFEGEGTQSIKVSEFLKAQEMICKLMGFDGSDGGDVLPETIELLLP